MDKEGLNEMADLNEIAESLSGLTVMEAAELATLLDHLAQGCEVLFATLAFEVSLRKRKHARLVGDRQSDSLRRDTRAVRQSAANAWSTHGRDIE